MAALHLPTGVLPVEARARIDELDALAKALDTFDELAREAELEQDNRTGFEEALSTLASAVVEPMTHEDADHRVSLLYEDLTAAREADRLSKQMDAEIGRATTRIQQARLAESYQRERLAELVRRACVQHG